jgi:hypothetical protein
MAPREAADPHPDPETVPPPDYPALAVGVTAIAWCGRRQKRLPLMSRADDDDAAATLQSA